MIPENYYLLRLVINELFIFEGIRKFNNQLAVIRIPGLQVRCYLQTSIILLYKLQMNRQLMNKVDGNLVPFLLFKKKIQSLKVSRSNL